MLSILLSTPTFHDTHGRLCPLSHTLVLSSGSRVGIFLINKLTFLFLFTYLAAPGLSCSMHMRSFFMYIIIYLLIFGWAGSSLLHRLFPSCGEWGLLSGCGACACCSLQQLLLLRSMGSRVWGLSNPQALERGLNSCGAQALLLCSRWDLPRSGNRVSCIDRLILYRWATKESLNRDIKKLRSRPFKNQTELSQLTLTPTVIVHLGS